MFQSFKDWLQKLFNQLFGNEIFRRMVKNSGYLFSARGITAALSMLQGILTARMLGVANFGILGAITLFTSVVNRFASFRMSELVIKYVGYYTEADEPEHAAAIFKTAVIVEFFTTLVAFALVLLLAPFGARYLAKDPAAVNWFMIYGLVIPANMIYESSTGLLQIFDRFGRFASINIIQGTVTLSLIVIIFFTQGTMLEVLLAYLIGKIVGSNGLTHAALSEASKQWGKHWYKTPLKILQPKKGELVHFAVSTNISSTISLITKDSEVLWVSFFRNPLEAGYYKLALSLANIAQLPIAPLPQATYPELSRQIAKKQFDNAKYVMRQGSILAGSYTLAAAIGLLFLGKPLISIVYGAEYLPAFPALLILIVGYLIANTFYWRRPALLALGYPEFPAKVNFVLAAIKIMATILLVPVYGYLASATLLASFYAAGSFIFVSKIRSIFKKETGAL
jgi:O-antigen/teichoic acid export membrane protein